MTAQASLIAALPKAELHLHIEGSFEPEQMMALAERNKVALPFKTLDEVKAATEMAVSTGDLDTEGCGGFGWSKAVPPGS